MSEVEDTTAQPAGAGQIVSAEDRANETLIAQHMGFNQGYVKGRKDQRTGQVLWMCLLLLPAVWAASYVHDSLVRRAFANSLYALCAELGVGALLLLARGLKEG